MQIELCIAELAHSLSDVCMTDGSLRTVAGMVQATGIWPHSLQLGSSDSHFPSQDAHCGAELAHSLLPDVRMADGSVRKVASINAGNDLWAAIAGAKHCVYIAKCVLASTVNALNACCSPSSMHKRPRSGFFHQRQYALAATAK